jgi:hypothetical protein
MNSTSTRHLFAKILLQAVLERSRILGGPAALTESTRPSRRGTNEQPLHHPLPGLPSPDGAAHPPDGRRGKGRRDRMSRLRGHPSTSLPMSTRRSSRASISNRRHFQRGNYASRSPDGELSVAHFQLASALAARRTGGSEVPGGQSLSGGAKLKAWRTSDRRTHPPGRKRSARATRADDEEIEDRRRPRIYTPSLAGADRLFSERAERRP